MTESVRRNGLGQPIGAAVPGWTARPLPRRVRLEGRWCRLEPLAASHADTLHAAYARAPDARDWTYLPDEPEPDLAAFRARIAARAASDDPLHWAVTVAHDALGSVALMRVDPGNGVVEIGHVHFAPPLQRTAAATEALFLLMRHACDELGYRRLEWKCDSLNAPSRRAALRLGFTFEGVFRQASVTKGRNRDTAWYAMTSQDWPNVRAAIERWLAPSNFRDGGRQIRSLDAFKADGA